MNDKIEEILKHPWSIPAAIGVLSFGSGLGIGYILGKRKQPEVETHKLPAQLELNFHEEPSMEMPRSVPPVKPVEIVKPPRVVITEDVAVEKNIIKVSDLSDLRPDMMEDEIDKRPDDTPEEEEPDVVITISPEVTDDIEWDYAVEIEKRSTTAPYVLHQEEFYADELSYTQSSLTFYSQDEIMADEDDKPVYNHTNVTGPLLFGHGSGDPNVVYIRNDKLRAEYEIIRLDALYSREVLGLEIENNERVSDLKHSKLTKFRMD